jgi:hypothetical protein
MKTGHDNQFKFVDVYFLENWKSSFIQLRPCSESPYISWCCVIFIVLLMWGSYYSLVAIIFSLLLFLFLDFFCYCFHMVLFFWHDEVIKILINY